jgi:hypothetical protein
MLRNGIDEMVADGASLAEIEHDLIDPAPVSEDVGAALWLYAWGTLERRRASPIVPS